MCVCTSYYIIHSLQSHVYISIVIIVIYSVWYMSVYYLSLVTQWTHYLFIDQRYVHVYK